MKLLKRVLLWGVLAAALAILFAAATNIWVLRKGRPRFLLSTSQVPSKDVAIVLGTSPHLRGGWTNPFFESRMDAAAKLYRTQKVRHFLLSGDNGTKEYDEPSAMRDALIKRGIPTAAITLDYAGFRTLDTMARAKTVFGLKSAVVVTDDFHLARSVFLARAKGIDAVGYGGEPVPWKWSMKTRLREIAGRSVAWLDVYVLRTEPKFHGKPETILLTENTSVGQ